jgi:hypothetical protein
VTAERERDPLERLRALNPVPAGRFDDLVWSVPAGALFRRIVDDDPTVGTGPGPRVRPIRLPHPADQRRPGRTRARVAVGAGGLVLSVAVAGYALVGRQPSKPQTVACFAAADLVADVEVVPVDSAGPVGACADVWAGGGFGGTAVPVLRPCLLESGVVGVFPEAKGADVCRDLGLAAAAGEGTPGSGTESERFLAFRDAVVARFIDEACLGQAPATAVVREELARAGLGGWTVSVGGGEGGAGFSADRPCALLELKPEARTVRLVPAPPSR